MPIRNPYAYWNASRRPHINEREVDRLDRRINRRVFDRQNYVYLCYSESNGVFAIASSRDVAQVLIDSNASIQRGRGRIEKRMVVYQDHIFD